MAWDGPRPTGTPPTPVSARTGDTFAVRYPGHKTSLPEDTNAHRHLPRDLQAGTTSRLSVSSADVQSNSISQPRPSARTGVRGLLQRARTWSRRQQQHLRPFVRDEVAGTTERVSVTTAGDESPCCSSLYPSITAEGDTWPSSPWPSRPADPEQQPEIYIRDGAGTHHARLPDRERRMSNTGIASPTSARTALLWPSRATATTRRPGPERLLPRRLVKDLVTVPRRWSARPTDGTWATRLLDALDQRRDGLHGVPRLGQHLVPGDTNTIPVYDISSSAHAARDHDAPQPHAQGGEADASSPTSSISADGSLVAFERHRHEPGARRLERLPTSTSPAAVPRAPRDELRVRFSSYRATEGGSATITVTNRAALHDGDRPVHDRGRHGGGGRRLRRGLGHAHVPGRRVEPHVRRALLDDAQDSRTNSRPHPRNPTAGPRWETRALPRSRSWTTRAADSPPDAVDDAAATNEDTAVSPIPCWTRLGPNGDTLFITRSLRVRMGPSPTTAWHADLHTSAERLRRRCVHLHDRGRQRRQRYGHRRRDHGAVNDPPRPEEDHYSVAAVHTLSVAAPECSATTADADGR